MVPRRPSKLYKDFSDDVQEDPEFGNSEMTYFSILSFTMLFRGYITQSPDRSNIPIALWVPVDLTLSPSSSCGNAVTRTVELSNHNSQRQQIL